MEDGFKITLELGPHHPLFDHGLKNLVDYQIYNLAARSNNGLVLERARALSLEQALPVYPHLRVQEPLEALWPQVERAFLIRGESNTFSGFESTEAALKVLPVEGRDIRVACYPEGTHQKQEWERMERLQALGVSAFVTDFVLDLKTLASFLEGCPPIYLIVSLLPGVWMHRNILMSRFPDRRIPPCLPESESSFLKDLKDLLKKNGRKHLQICSFGDPVKAVRLFNCGGRPVDTKDHRAVKRFSVES